MHLKLRRHNPLQPRVLHGKVDRLLRIRSVWLGYRHISTGGNRFATRMMLSRKPNRTG
jgi:hypothetical protein